MFRRNVILTSSTFEELAEKVSVCYFLSLLFGAGIGDITFFRYFGKFLPDYTA
jgi:hypothetical protein